MTKLISVALAALLVISVFPTASVPKEVAPHPEVKISIYTGRVGTMNWTLCQGLSDIVLKNSKWLKPTVVDTTGATEIYKIMAARPELRTKSIWYSGVDNDMLARRGFKPLPKYTTARPIMLLTGGGGTLGTLNPEIKTLADLEGKKVDVGIKGSFLHIVDLVPILEAAGVLDKVKTYNLGWRKGPEAMADGLIDATYFSMTPSEPGGQWAPNKALTKLLATKKVYFIDFGEDVIMKAKKSTGYPIFPMVIPAGAFGKGVPPKDVMGNAYLQAWYADAELSEDIVYEIVRLAWEHINDFRLYHHAGKQYSAEGMAALPYPEEEWHPGAVKFYKDKGIKIGQ